MYQDGVTQSAGTSQDFRRAACASAMLGLIAMTPGCARQEEGKEKDLAPPAEIAPGYLRARYLQSLSLDSTVVAWMASDRGGGPPSGTCRTTSTTAPSIMPASGKPKKSLPTKHCGPTAFFRDEVLLWTQVFVDGPTCTIRTWESLSGDLVDQVVISKTRLARKPQ